jgi:hypothetical protein
MVLGIAPKRSFKTFHHLKRFLPFGKPIAVKRSTSAIPYIERTGWERATSTTPAEWRGYFRTRFGSYKGRIIASTPPQYYIYKPPKGLKERHSHAACFSKLGEDGWFSVHFSKVPKDLDSGVIKLERILCEAYLLTQKSA